MKNVRNYGISLILLAGLFIGTLSVSEQAIQFAPRLVEHYQNIQDPEVKQDLLRLAERVRNDITVINWNPRIQQEIEETLKQNTTRPAALRFLTLLGDIYTDFKANMGRFRRDPALPSRFSLVEIVNQLKGEPEFSSEVKPVRMHIQAFLGDAQAKQQFKELLAEALESNYSLQDIINRLQHLKERVDSETQEGRARQDKIARVITTLDNVKNAVASLQTMNKLSPEDRNQNIHRMRASTYNQIINGAIEIAQAAGEHNLVAIIKRIKIGLGQPFGQPTPGAVGLLGDAQAKKEFKGLVAIALAYNADLAVLRQQLNDLLRRVSPEEGARRDKIARVIALLSNVEQAIEMVQAAQGNITQPNAQAALELIKNAVQTARASDEEDLANLISKKAKGL